jgi:3-dehydrotetronate 4-kinase
VTPALGCIADDYTGATDAASAFRKAGLRTVLWFGVPSSNTRPSDADVIVVALKSRSIEPDTAVREVEETWGWLSGAGTRRAFFKVASTFDSTRAGNIGPVADALLDATGTRISAVTPAAPGHGRTVREGILWVGGERLSESPMRHHPLNPMTESNLVTLLAAQSAHPVGLVPLTAVRGGWDAVSAELAALADAGVRHAVVDAVSDADLDVVAEAAERTSVVVGAAGLAAAVGRRLATTVSASESVVVPVGRTLVLAGSCSVRTREQVDRAASVMPTFDLPVATGASPGQLASAATAWLDAHAAAPAAVIATCALSDATGSAAPDAQAAAAVEQAMAAAARHAVASGFRRLVVAGGETSGAVVAGLGIGSAIVGPDAATGVPWIVVPERNLALLLKSGNFGDPDLFVTAASMSRGDA